MCVYVCVCVCYGCELVKITSDLEGFKQVRVCVYIYIYMCVSVSVMHVCACV